MANADRPGRLSQVPFHGPLSEARAARLTERLTRNHPGTVLDIGCGWGELMLRILAAAPGATGVGIDLDDDDLARGRAGARDRGLSEEWLAAHPDHPEAAEIRQRVDEHRSYWLRGYRGLLGFAYLTLVPVG